MDGKGGRERSRRDALHLSPSIAVQPKGGGGKRVGGETGPGKKKRIERKREGISPSLPYFPGEEKNKGGISAEGGGWKRGRGNRA